MQEVNRIHPLEPATTSLLRSTVVLPSLPSIAIELVHNSLDAQSTSINLSIDLTTWTIRCDDNGHGISIEDLTKFERYRTNKVVGGEGSSSSSYGFRGEALDSMQDVGLLEVSSRKVGARETGYVVKKNGQVLASGVSSVDRFNAGTTVWVRDIYRKFPVRRKPFSNPSAQATLLSTLQSRLSTLSLVHPHVSFNLSDTSETPSKSLMSVSKSNQGIVGRWRQLWGRAGTEKIYEVNEEENEEGITGLKVEGFFSLTASHSRSSQYIFVNSYPIAPSSLDKSLNHLFSTSSFSRHSASHLSLPTPSPTRPSSPIAHISPLDLSKQPNDPITTKNTTTSTPKGRNTPKRVSERYPVFCLALKVPWDQVDVTLEPEKQVVEFNNENQIERFVLHVARRFLESQGYLNPIKPKRRFDETVERVEERREETILGIDDDEIGEESPTKFRKRSRIQTPVFLDQPERDIDPVTIYPSTRSTSNDSNTSNLLRFIDPNTHQSFLIDSRTGNNWRTDLGMARSEKRLGEDEEGCSRCHRGENRDLGTTIVDRSRLRKRDSRIVTGQGQSETDEERKGMPAWLETTLSNWRNPIFPSSKPAPSIPALAPLDRPSLSVPPTLPKSFSSSKRNVSNSSSKTRSSSIALTRSRLSTLSTFFSSGNAASNVPPSLDLTETLSSTETFSKGQVRDAEFIAQVDQKFLLVKLPSLKALGEGDNEGTTSTGLDGDASSSLVLFDQHAVSERIRVEKFLSQIVGPDRQVEVERSEDEDQGRNGRCEENGKGIVVSREEAKELETRIEEFRRWGFKVVVPSLSSPSKKVGGASTVGTGVGGDLDYVQVWIKTVPRIVSNRLVDESVLQEVIRGYLAQLRDRSSVAKRRDVGDGDVHCGSSSNEGWTNDLKDCPTGLVDLINSKACRGAIMFNDPLTDQQAVELLSQLATTRFPFQCAHGRPSIVPLFNLPSSSFSSSNSEPLKTASPISSSSSSSSRRRPSRSIDWNRLI